VGRKKETIIGKFRKLIAEGVSASTRRKKGGMGAGTN